MYNGYTMGQWAESWDNFFMGVQWIFERLLNLHWWLIGLGILSSILGFNVSESTTGWWFGTWCLFVHSVGNVIIPTDFHMFHRGRYTTNQIMLESLLTNGAMEWRRVFFTLLNCPPGWLRCFKNQWEYHWDPRINLGFVLFDVGLGYYNGGYTKNEWIGLVGNILTGNHHFFYHPIYILYIYIYIIGVSCRFSLNPIQWKKLAARVSKMGNAWLTVAILFRLWLSCLHVHFERMRKCGIQPVP